MREFLSKNTFIKWILYWFIGSIIIGLLSGNLFQDISALASSLFFSFPLFIVGYVLVEKVISNSGRKTLDMIYLLFVGLFALYFYNIIFSL